MSTSPFFSGRIPQELYDKVDEYCKETGKNRTQVLIEALSTYLDFPVRTQTINFAPQPVEVTKKMFESLQQQVNKLELLVIQKQCTDSSNVEPIPSLSDFFQKTHEKHYGKKAK